MSDATGTSPRVRTGAKDDLRGAAALFRSTVIAPTEPDAGPRPAPTPAAAAPEKSRQTAPVVPSPAPQTPTISAPALTSTRLPQAARDRLAARSQRTDGNLARGTYYFRRDQLVDLKRIRQRTLEMSGEEVDLSDLVREGIDLLLKRYSPLLGQTGSPSPNTGDGSRDLE